MKTWKVLWQVMMVLCVCVFTVNIVSYPQPEVTEVLSKYGSRSEEVRQIQTKLKQWGYYFGSVDGIYGTQTQDAVIKFQKKNGLTVDGIAGPATLKAMGIFSSSGNSSSSSSGVFFSASVSRMSSERVRVRRLS